MEYQTPFKRQRTRESSATGAARHHLPYDNSLYINQQTTIHIRQILTSLQEAVSSKQRLAALHQFLSFLRYDPSTRLFQSSPGILSQFLEGKCIHSLCLQLGYTIHRQFFTSSGEYVHSTKNTLSNEMKLICVALDTFYRQCPQLVNEESIRNSGSEVLRLTREVLSQEERNVFDSASPLVRPIVSIWHSFSSCNFGTTLLLQHPDTLKIINLILSVQKKTFHHNPIDGVEIIIECLGLLKNLSYYGEDYRYRIVNEADLLSSLTSLTDIPSDKARERLSAVFRNLALSVDVRSGLAQRGDVLTALFRISNFCVSTAATNSDIQNLKKNTLRNIFSTITSLAIDTSTSHLMVFHGDGVFIEQLKQFARHCKDPVARKRAIKALRLLAKDPSSIPVMILQNNQLLEILSDRALYDTNDSVRAEATEAFCKCANLIRAPMAQHDCVLDALTRMLTNASPTNLDALARALQEQANYQENRRPMLRHRNLLEALAALIGSENATLGAKESACSTLVDLSEEPIEPDTIELPNLLDALVQVLREPLPQSRGNNAATNIDVIVTNRIRESSVKTILNLAKTPSNRRDMARQTSLIQSLLRFAAATTTADNVKKQVKAVILQLATEL